MLVFVFFFFKQKTAYEIMPSLVGSEMCIRDRASCFQDDNNVNFRKPIRAFQDEEAGSSREQLVFLFLYFPSSSSVWAHQCVGLSSLANFNLSLYKQHLSQWNGQPMYSALILSLIHI
eukprot:TRINITY_DN27572_c0_g1_i1.p1 TRINITY_DN27572_c0_g1~~TRINITY_DN27572_c0_g1_i1.p1  ORF type:complete len:118 (+),score=10.52 TRINITY_DN27572_c0_g1_i1:22-375(+)